VSEVRERAAGVAVLRPAVEVDLELPAASYGAAGRLVLAGMASRLGMTVDRIDELQLAVDTILRRSVVDDTFSIRMRPDTHALDVRVGPLSLDERERDDLEDVLSALADEVTTHETEDDVWVDLRCFHGLLAPGR
jgi:hypothetical protein